VDHQEGLDALAELTGIEVDRLAELRNGGLFNCLEAQVVTVALGITMDEVFGEEPDEETREEIRCMEGAGLAAGVGIPPDPEKSADIPQEAFDKSLERLYYYAKCLKALG